MIFWIAAAIAALFAAAWVVRPLALARAPARSRAAHDEQVFRDQLAEIDRDVERGVLTPSEAEAARIEVSRRLLGAAAEMERSPDHRPAPKWASAALAAAVLIGAPLGAAAIYGAIGVPGLPDQPHAERPGQRPSQEVAERLAGAPPLSPAGEAAEEMIARLQERVEGDQADPQGLYLLARSLGEVGRFGESWRAYDRLMDVAGGDAPAAIHVAKAEAMINAAGGYVSPEAESALEQALRQDPTDAIARYYMGVALAQTERPRSAMETWSRLLADSPPDAPWAAATRSQIAELSRRAGLPAPGAEQAAGSAPTEDAREAMEALAARLDARLSAEDGQTEAGSAEAGSAEAGSAEDWARLIRTYRALGREDAARDAETRAREALAAPEALAALDGALAGGAPLPGPDAAAVAAAGDMDPEARAAMIRGMVDGLRERLSAEGGPVEEWARLIRSLAVLGESEAAKEAYAGAVADHAGDSASLAFLKERALVAGLDVE